MLLNEKVVEDIDLIYNTVDDIDLYVGGLAEKRIVGNTVGPTFNCLMGENFKQIKYTDRYFYEMGGQPHSFSSGKTLTNLIKKNSTDSNLFNLIFSPTYRN